MPGFREEITDDQITRIRKIAAELDRAPSTGMDAWLRDRDREGTVVHYELPKGWAYVPRRKGVDTDVIRLPVQPTTQRKARE